MSNVKIMKQISTTSWNWKIRNDTLILEGIESKTKQELFSTGGGLD